MSAPFPTTKPSIDDNPYFATIHLKLYHQPQRRRPPSSPAALQQSRPPAQPPSPQYRRDGGPPVAVAIPIPSVDDDGVHSNLQLPDGRRRVNASTHSLFLFFSIFFFYIFFSTQLFSMAPAQPVQRSSSKCLKYGYPARNRVATQAGRNIEKVTKVRLTVRVARIS